MNKFIKKLIIPTFIVIIALGSFASVAFAANPPLSVTFSSTPLFNIDNFLPRDEAHANIIVGNSDTILRSAYVEAINIFNSDDLANQMNLKIFEGLTEIYNDNFGTFLNAGPVFLSDIGASGSKTYNLKITFLESSSNNNYQGKTLGFDICVGFAGGNQTCTDTISVGLEQNPGGNPSTDSTSSPQTSPGSSSGGSSGGQHLLIWDENTSNISANGIILESGFVTITWNTNIRATSQVVYGLASSAPYPFNINTLPSFGYPFVNTEDLAKTTNHSMLLVGLTPGETYVYRVVSRASPPTISYEHQFTVPKSSQTENTITTGFLAVSGAREGSDGRISEVNGIIEEGIISATSTEGEVAGVFDNNNLANIFSAGFWDNWLKYPFWVIILLFVVYFIWKKTRNRKNNP